VRFLRRRRSNSNPKTVYGTTALTTNVLCNSGCLSQSSTKLRSTSALANPSVPAQTAPQHRSGVLQTVQEPDSLRGPLWKSMLPDSPPARVRPVVLFRSSHGPAKWTYLDHPDSHSSILSKFGPLLEPRSPTLLSGGDGASGPTDGEAGSRPQKIVRELALLPTSRSLGPQPPKQHP
jgi:hypothetical protein